MPQGGLAMDEPGDPAGEAEGAGALQPPGAGGIIDDRIAEIMVYLYEVLPR